MVRAHMYYSGMVQGVGFRYTVYRLAADLKLAGWVRNLTDGRVEALVEGPKDTIEIFLNKIENHFQHQIRNKEIDFQKAQGQFQGFQIVF